KIEKNGIHFHFIPTNKFKTVNMVIKCKTTLNRETVTKREMLHYVLEKATKNHPTEKAFMKALDGLYGADSYINGDKRYDAHILTLRLDVPNYKYLKKEDHLTAGAFHLLHEALYHPYTDNGSFSETSGAHEKQTLKNNLISIHDDK